MRLTKVWMMLAGVLVVVGCGPGDDPGERTVPNEAPEIGSMTANPPQVAPGEEATVEAQASDPDGDEIEYAWTASGDWSVEAGEEEPSTATVTAPQAYDATGEITLTVTDADGDSAEKTLEITTPTNNGPLVSSLTANPTEVPMGGTSDLKVRATDPDGGELTYSWSVDGMGWSIMGEGNEVTLQAPDQRGVSATIDVTVTDAGGDEAVASAVVSTVENTEPVINALNAQPLPVVPGNTTTVAASAADADGDDLTFSWSAPSDWSLNGSGNEVELTAPDSYGATGKVELTVEDGNGGAATAELRVTTEQNQAPQISSLTANPMRVAPGQKTTVKAVASDPLGDDLTYEWTVPSDWTKSGMGNTIEVTAPNAYDKTAQVDLVVKDGNGEQASASVEIATGANRDPLITSLNANPSSVAPSGTVTVTAMASDPNGDPVNYDWTVPSGWTKTSEMNNTLTLTAPASYGQTGTVQLKVDDGFGGEATSTVDVTTAKNQAPIISSLTTSSLVLDRQGTADLEVTATDPNGDSLSYSWTIQGQNWSISKDGMTPSMATATAPDAPESRALVKVEVSDGNGGTTTAAQNLETVRNLPPSILKPSSNLSVGDAANPGPISHSREFTYQVQAQDQDGDALTYTLNSSTSASIDQSGEITWTPPLGAVGTHTLTIEVSDGYDTDSRTIAMKVTEFGLQGELPTSVTSGTKQFVWADVNDDGRLDAIHGDTTGSSFFEPSAGLNVYMGSSSGFGSVNEFTFTDSTDWEDCNALAAGDVDGDGDVDLATVCESNGTSSTTQNLDYVIWENDKTHSGNFKVLEKGNWTFTDTYNVNDAEFGDLDDDNDLDLAVSAGDRLVIAKNDGSGSFSTTISAHRPDDSGSDFTEFMDVAMGDIDGDDQTDVWVSFEHTASGTGAEILVYSLDAMGQVGMPKEAFSLPQATETSFQLWTGDLDGDSDPDAAVLDADTDKLHLVENDAGTLKQIAEHDFGTVTSPGGINVTRGLDAADFNADGNMDLAVTYGAGSTEMAVVFGDGSVGITDVDTFRLGSSFSGSVDALHVTDWDGNGLPDILFGTDTQLGIAR